VNLRREARWLRPIALIVVLALACGGYILNRQRLESPLAERTTLHLEFAAVDAVTPGLGSPVTVAGDTVVQIEGRRLDGGRGVLRVAIDPDKLPAVHADARAALVPNTALKDMQVRLSPGSRDAPKLGDGARIPLAVTTSPIDGDELLRALDDDTRTWVRSLMNDLGTGTRGRGRSLRATLRRLGPTAAQLRRISSLLADRRRRLRRLVGDLRVITEATTAGDGELERVVEAGNATLAALATNDGPLRATLDELPGTLAAARSTLDRTPRFTAETTRALRALRPSIRRARATLRATPGALEGVVPLPVAETKEFVDAVAPLGPAVRSAAADVGAAAPPLRTAFGVLGRTSNRLASTPPDGGKSSLFWLAWFAHNVNSTLTTQDAHGAVARGMALFSCSSLATAGELGEAIDELIGTGTTCEGGGRR
jgi:phospholipid/cholesterol/gamma-HCH transport system substrate-binding protein